MAFSQKLTKLYLGGESIQDSFLQLCDILEHLKVGFYFDRPHIHEYFLDGVDNIVNGVSFRVQCVHAKECLVYLLIDDEVQYFLQFLYGGNVANGQDHLFCDNFPYVTALLPLTEKWHACRLLIACLMSPSATKSKVLKASVLILTPSPLMILAKLSSTSSSLSLLKRRMMHLLCMASMIFCELLQLNTKRVVSLQLLMIILRACCAPSVRLSASSRMMTLVRPGGRDTFLQANVLICSLTTSIPLSSDAFSSSTASLHLFPSISLTMHRTVDVLPTPGGPLRIRWGMLPCPTHVRKVFTCSMLPNTSFSSFGRYFSSQISFDPLIYYWLYKLIAYTIYNAFNMDQFLLIILRGLLSLKVWLFLLGCRRSVAFILFGSSLMEQPSIRANGRIYPAKFTWHNWLFILVWYVIALKYCCRSLSPIGNQFSVKQPPFTMTVLEL